MLPLYLAGCLLLLIALWVAYTYNLVVRMRNKAQEAFSGIDVQLKQRRDLVPNLVAAVDAYARYERGALKHVTQARAAAAAAAGPEAVGAAENELAAQMRGLVAVAENYADLRASQNYLALMHELTDVENEIQASRSLYNQNVEMLRSYAESFPARLVASRVGGIELPFLTFDRAQQAAGQIIKDFAA